MPAWIGPTVALSLVVIAIVVVAISVIVVLALRAAHAGGESVAREVGQLRSELAPMLAAVARLGTQGADVVEMAQDEAQQIVETTRRIRHDIERGVTRAKGRLADFEATIEVVQDEIDAAVIDVGAALETARSSVGMIGQLRRLIRPRRRGAA